MFRQRGHFNCLVVGLGSTKSIASGARLDVGLDVVGHTSFSSFTASYVS